MFRSPTASWVWKITLLVLEEVYVLDLRYAQAEISKSPGRVKGSNAMVRVPSEPRCKDPAPFWTTSVERIVGCCTDTTSHGILYQ